MAVFPLETPFGILTSSHLKSIGQGLAGAFVVYKIGQYVRSTWHQQALRKSVDDFISKRDERIDRLALYLESRYLTDEEVDEITGLSLVDLVEQLQDERLTPVRVLEAYQKKAIDAHRHTNCITEFVEGAQPHALELEAIYGEEEKKPPLYGVPVSIKESIQMKGYISTRGYAQTILNNDVATEDAYIVQLLTSLGAVPFCRTNVPQTLLAFNCCNPVYGKTNHPLSKDRTPGGSSGGEAALVAMKGSPLGIGGDVGGSIRAPAHFSGICGLKPTSNRFTQVGSMGSIPGRPNVESSIGPMAKTVKDVEFFMKTLLGTRMFDLDPLVAPVPYRDNISKKSNLKIGVYYDDEVFEAVPACVEAVLKAKRALEARGHTVLEVAPYRHPEGMGLFYAACLIDGGQYLLENLRNDLMEPNYKHMVNLLSLPKMFIRFGIFMKRMISPTEAAAQEHFFKDTAKLRQIYARHTEYKREFIQNWQSLGLDGMICPANGSVAMFHDGPTKAFACVSYTAIYNALNCPAGVVQTHHVTETDLSLLEDYGSRKPEPMKKVVVENNRDTLGYPVGAQVVALPYHEEMCLNIMLEIERGLKMLE